MEIRLSRHSRHIAIVTIDNQPRLNAMTRQMLEETADTFGMLDNQNRELDLLLSSGSSSK